MSLVSFRGSTWQTVVHPYGPVCMTSCLTRLTINLRLTMAEPSDMINGFIRGVMLAKFTSPSNSACELQLQGLPPVLLITCAYDNIWSIGHCHPYANGAGSGRSWSPWHPGFDSRGGAATLNRFRRDLHTAIEWHGRWRNAAFVMWDSICQCIIFGVQWGWNACHPILALGCQPF